MPYTLILAREYDEMSKSAARMLKNYWPSLVAEYSKPEDRNNKVDSDGDKVVTINPDDKFVSTVYPKLNPNQQEAVLELGTLILGSKEVT